MKRLPFSIAITLLLCANPSFSATYTGDNIAFSKLVGYEGSVLLENRNETLPLPAGSRVAVFGINQLDYVKGGGGSADSRVAYVHDLAYGLAQKEAEGSIFVCRELEEFYRQAYRSGRRNADEPEVDDTIMHKARAFADIAIISIGRRSGEGGDRSPGKGDYMLSDSEKAMIDRVTAAGFRKVVVVLNTGAVIDSSWFKGNKNIDAVLLNWQAGMEGGAILADLLTGQAYPSGKLTDTFAKNYGDYPSAAGFGQSRLYVDYDEDIYVGYRYFETMAREKVNYEFGYGLGYTIFTIDRVTALQDGGDIKVTARVRNAGKRPGKEVVQVYFQAPQGLLGKPARQLAAFAKTGELGPGQSQTVTLAFPVNDMASFDDAGAVSDASFVLEKGVYRFYVGNSVRNAREAAFRYTIEENKVVERLSHRLSPVMLPRRLKADGSYETMAVGTHRVRADGFCKIEAEDYRACHPDLRKEEFRYPGSHHGRNGICMAYFDAPGRWLEYSLGVERAGYYDVWLSASGVNDKAVDVFAISVDGEAQKVTAGVPKTGSRSKGEWHNFTFAPSFRIYLPQGACTLRCENRADGVNIDYMVVERIAENAGAPAKVKTPSPANRRILLDEAEEDRSLMPAFLSQISDENLFRLSTGTDNMGLPVRTESLGDMWRYGIPNIQTSDGPSGVHLNGGVATTGFPNPTMLACTWNTPLAEEFGVRIARECLSYDIDILLAPGLNIHRNPLCGRNFEYYSEDPLITGRMAAAVTRGSQSQNVAVAIKHFAANNKEENRHGCDSRVSERALREIYLRGFRIAVEEAKPKTVMGSYNPINGIKASENYDLMTAILRGEWGFRGLVMSDWITGGSHALEAKAGTDVKMPWGDSESLKNAMDRGLLKRSELHRNMERLMDLAAGSNAFKRMESGND